MSSSGEEVISAKIIIKHRYSEPWDDSDVILVVEDEKFHVHSNILGFASPVFKTMFSSDFKDGKEKVVNLPGKSKATIKDMLDLIYPGYFLITNFSTCRALLNIAREYDIRSIKLYVDDFINEQIDCSFQILQVAEDFDLTKTRTKLVDFYVKTWNAVGMFDDNWSNISDDTKIRITKSKTKELSHKYTGLGFSFGSNEDDENGFSDFRSNKSSVVHQSQPCSRCVNSSMQLTDLTKKMKILTTMIHAFYPDHCFNDHFENNFLLNV